jgi:hypothetical protein
MAYFNHAFTKVFLGTQTTVQNANANLTNGFIDTAGIPSVSLGNVNTGVTNNNYGPGTYGFFDPNTWLSVDTTYFSGGAHQCCPLVLAAASLMTNDKLGPFHGGYKESNKSKMINPRYVQRFYRVDTCVPQQSVISIGNTPGTTGNFIATVAAPVVGTETYVNGSYTNIILIGGTGFGALASVTVAGNAVTAVTITNPGIGYTVADVLTLSSAAVPTAGSLTELVAGTATTVAVATLAQLDPNDFENPNEQNCCFEFLCGETYYLRVDIKGSPALRFLNRNAYQNVAAYTGCCAGPTPTVVDSTLVMIEWAKALVENQLLVPLVAPVVFDETGVPWYAPGTTITLDGTNTVVTSAQWWDAYVSPGHVASACAGLRLYGAYVETKFGNCSFQITDFFEKEPVQLYASLVDYNGDPCVFEGICVYKECRGVQGMGFGEQVVRDLILSESYLQNFFASNDMRIREITQGDQILNAVSRNALYTRYFLLHSVPRHNNPSGMYDADRYMLEIIVTEPNPLVPVGNATLEAFVAAWLGACPKCVTLEVESCTRCEILPDDLEA